MLKSFVRISAFFSKEISEVLRQPRLILALILGPFLILVLFGVGYRAAPPSLKGILVIPDTLSKQIDTTALQSAANLTFQVVSVTNDPQAALAQLQANQVDVVEIIPADAQTRLEQGQGVPVEFHYTEINPLNETWIQSLGYAQVNEMNKALLLQSTIRIQQEARSNQGWVTSAQQDLDTLSGTMSDAELTKRQASIRQLRTLVGTLLASPVLLQAAAPNANPDDTKQQLTALAKELDTLDQAISNHTLSQESTHIDAARASMTKLQTLLETFSRTPPQVIVSPLQPQYKNESGQALSLTIFYTPAVLALILQHIAVTLGALSLVRERLLGAIEMFRVAPVSTRQILLGKYLAYTLFLAIIAGLLTFGMTVIQVPLRGNMGSFIGLLALLILASLGIGLLISILSKSETQAVQLSMLMLLLSIFFGGFFLPLENFWAPIRIISYLLPLTHGILGLQDIMLRGIEPTLWVWLALGGIALVSFLLVNLFAGRQLRFAQG